MKKFVGRLVAGMSVLVLGLMIAGRRQSVEVSIAPKTITNDLDSYLMQSESQYSDITPGAEKTIVWADSANMKTPFSIVYLHGFSATRQETAPLSDRIAASIGANLYYTRLSGHGRSDDAMGEPTVNDWLNDAMEAFEIGRQIGDKVILIGTSTGGTIATWLAGNVPHEDLASLILLSPNFWPKASGVGMVLWPGGRQLLNMIRGEYMEWEPSNEAQGKYWTTRYPSSAIVEMMQLVDLVDRMDLSAIQTPLLVLYSPNDQVVDPAPIETTFERFGSPARYIEALEEVGDRNDHVLAGDILSPDDTDRVAKMILKFLFDVLHK